MSKPTSINALWDGLAPVIDAWGKQSKDKEQNENHSLASFIKQFVYVEDGDQVCDLNRPAEYKMPCLKVFHNSMANIRLEIPAPTKNEPEKTKYIPISQAWLVAPQRVSALGSQYNPAKKERVYQDDNGYKWVNEFRMPKFKETSEQGELQIFNDHMCYLFPEEVERIWFINWMAFNLQYPETRCKVTPLHIAKAHGTGRGWIVELMALLLGEWNQGKTKMKTLCGEGSAGAFQDYFNKTLLCAIEEVKEGDKRFSISDTIRDLLTEPRLEINLKYGGKQTQNVFTNFFFMSNHPDALVIPVQDRRINVFSGPDTVRNGDYYTQLYNWLKTEGVGQLHAYLTNLDLSDFNWKTSMKTFARTLMIENNRNPTEVLFFELMEKPPYPFMTFQQIISEMRSLSPDHFIDLEEGQITKLLQHNADQLKALKINGYTVRPWMLIKAGNPTNAKIRRSVEQISL